MIWGIVICVLFVIFWLFACYLNYIFNGKEPEKGNPPESKKGQQCPYKPILLCQEGYCQECQIYKERR